MVVIKEWGIAILLDYSQKLSFSIDDLNLVPR
jgi:hypothetical protein